MRTTMYMRTNNLKIANTLSIVIVADLLIKDLI